MSDLIKDVENKLKEYDFKIYDQYPLEDESYMFMVENFAVSVDQKNKDISIAFQATIKPETAAQNILILNELVIEEKINKIFVMSSFIFSPCKQIMFGDEAFKKIKQTIENNAIRKHNEELLMTKMLQTAKCYEC